LLFVGAKDERLRHKMSALQSSSGGSLTFVILFDAKFSYFLLLNTTPINWRVGAMKVATEEVAFSSVARRSPWQLSHSPPSRHLSTFQWRFAGSLHNIQGKTVAWAWF